MISYDEALAAMLARTTVPESETVPIAQAAGRVLAEPVIAAVDAPRADVSAMDGFAVRLADTEGDEPLALVGEAAAGAPFAGEIGPGQAVRIFTGAHLPAGADCVIMQEYAQVDETSVRFRPGFGPGRHIRQRAGDFARGDVILPAGTMLTPTALVALAGADHAGIAVAMQPRVAIIATGDELVDPGSAARSANGLPESGSFGVAAMAAQWGGDVVAKLRGRDALEELQRLAKQAVDRADLVVVIGGASVGQRDFAKPMFERAGLDLVFSRIAIKPGKPVWFGGAAGAAVLGLPGNPGSAMVTARLFLAPLLRALQGGDGTAAVRFARLPLAASLPDNGSRETFARATLGPEGLVPVGNQESGAQSPLAASDWLIRRAPHAPAAAPGELVPALPF